MGYYQIQQIWEGCPEILVLEPRQKDEGELDSQDGVRFKKYFFKELPVQRIEWRISLVHSTDWKRTTLTKM